MDASYADDCTPAAIHDLEIMSLNSDMVIYLQKRLTKSGRRRNNNFDSWY